MPKELAQKLADIVSDLPEAIVQSVVSELTASGVNPPTFQRLLSSDVRSRVIETLRYAHRAGFDSRSVALAMYSAFFAHETSRTTQSVELVWTGPSPPHTHLRRTDQALVEIIDGAQSELWVVSFAAYRVPTVMDSLQRALARGVLVSLVLESSEQSEGRLSADQIYQLRAALNHAISVYVWPTEKRRVNNGQRGMLHAKCALADSTHLLVSSANLTEAAMQLNIELGALINSCRHAKCVQGQLRWLVESGTLKRL
ncbi:MAG: hypothetical protein JNM43_00045 [Planctomycetaceae bacterium]|nr:hypothetical protein [Planctomycetaceae bacterium]